jgi:hypothetical protein
MHETIFFSDDEGDGYFGYELLTLPQCVMAAEEDDRHHPPPDPKKRMVTLADLERQLERPTKTTNTLRELQQKWEPETPW